MQQASLGFVWFMTNVSERIPRGRTYTQTGINMYVADTQSNKCETQLCNGTEKKRHKERN
jgi:hypothetical protein